MPQHEDLEKLLNSYLQTGKGINKIQKELLHHHSYGKGCSYYNWSIHKLFGHCLATNWRSQFGPELEAIHQEYYYRCNLSDMEPDDMAEGYTLCLPYIIKKERLAKESMSKIRSPKKRQDKTSPWDRVTRNKKAA